MAHPRLSPSHAPSDVFSLAVKVEKKALPEEANSALKEFGRAACCIAAGRQSIEPRVGKQY
jgi:hypothetical protein